MSNASNLNVANIATALPLTAGSSVAFNNPGGGKGLATFQVTGTYIGQIAVATSLDGLNFVSLPNTDIQNEHDNSFGISANATGKFQISVGAGTVYVYLSAYTSGAATVTLSVGSGGGGGNSGTGSETVVIPTQGTPTTTTPTFTNATSFTLLVANANRKYLSVQNNSSGNIMVGWNGEALTGIIPTASNIGFVIPAGGSYEWPAQYVPTGIIKGYQTSGGTINTVVVVEGS